MTMWFAGAAIVGAAALGMGTNGDDDSGQVPGLPGVTHDDLRHVTGGQRPLPGEDGASYCRRQQQTSEESGFDMDGCSFKGHDYIRDGRWVG